MVTGDADREGVESRKDRVGVGRGFQDARRQQSLVRHGRAQGATPGSKAASSLTWRVRGNQQKWGQQKWGQAWQVAIYSVS